MTQPAKSQEPSMEEILASIRRIIADDDASKSAQKPVEAAKAPPAAAARPVSPPPPRPPAPPMPPVRVAPPQPSLTEFEEPEPVPEAVPSEEASDQTSDILDLTESMTTAPLSTPTEFRTIDGSPDVSFEDVSERPAAPRASEMPRPPVAPSRAMPEDDERTRLISGATSAAVDSAFNTLAHTVLVQNARTLEDLVREMLRPMLKAWLDDNLPGVVERLVRAEIERVARGRMG